MALKDTWADKVDYQDTVRASDINKVAGAVIALESKSDGTASESEEYIFDSFPTAEQILSLPNDTHFKVRSQGNSDKQESACYFKTSSWRQNALIFKDSDEKNVYVVPTSQPVSEVYLPFYGIRTGEENAESNSDIIEQLIETTEFGSTYRLPTGHFYFERPLDLSEKMISLIGEVNASFKNTNIFGTTWLHFNNLEEGQAALTVHQCTVSDLTVVGNPEQYSLIVERNNAFSDIDTVFTENASVKAYGVKTSGTIIMRNFGIRNFYYGCESGSANVFIQNAAFEQCHLGLSTGTDTKVYNIWGVSVMILLQMRGGLGSVIGARGDSIGEHLIVLKDGFGYSLYDVDADFCMGAILSIGDGISGETVRDLTVTGIRGRAGVKHFFSTETAEITAENITAETAQEYGVITVRNGSTLDGAVVLTNQQYKDLNPFDGTVGWSVPFVLLSVGVGATVKSVQITSTADEASLNADWANKRIASFSSELCDVTVTLNNGYFKYIKQNGIVTVRDDATNIYNRMDKSELAFKGEVVTSVNGIQPDALGNVEVVQEEPEEVASKDEFVDTSKKYILDGYVYSYRRIFVKGETIPNFTNQLPISVDVLDSDKVVLNGVGYEAGLLWEYDWDSNAFVKASSSYDGMSATGGIPVKAGDIVRINKVGYVIKGGEDMLAVGATGVGMTGIRPTAFDKITAGGGSYVLAGGTEGVDAFGVLADVEVHINNATYGWVVNDDSDESLYFFIMFADNVPADEMIVTVNEEITYTVTQDRYEWQWVKGELYDKPDYSALISGLETQIQSLEERISALEGV